MMLDMERTTKTEVRAVFSRMCRTYGVPEGGVFDADTATMSRGWALDYNPTYGGWTIVGYDGKGTGQSHPCGAHRMPARAFVATMHFAIQARLFAPDCAPLKS